MNFKKILAGITALSCCTALLMYIPENQSGNVSATEMVSNNFETDYEGWYGNSDSVVIKAVGGIGFNSSRGMTVSGRTAANDGASSSKGLYLTGGVEYTYSVKVYSETDETFRLSLLCLDGETDEKTEKELVVKDVKAGEWTELSAVYTAPENSYEFNMTIKTDSTNDFVFDEVKVTTEKSGYEVAAAASNLGLKDEFANYFRVGNILNGGTVKNSAITANIIKDYNSIECENETKPDATLNQAQCSGTNIGVKLDSAAAIFDFCIKNNIAVRGHTLVWHSQTPQWFFKDNFQDGGNWVSSSVMDQRMESYIKNLFAAIKTQYPSLNLYAYDVANECVSDDSNRTANNGGAREPGYKDGKSPWVQVYGDNSFVEKAFTYARKYAPEGCDLYYNDYNEYWDHKRDCIYNMCKSLYEKGLLDGVGMQSHVPANATGFAGTDSYIEAMYKYLSIGCDVQVTELDISVENGKYSYDDQAAKYKAIFQAAMDWNKNPKSDGRVTLVAIWGPNDANSWLSAGSNGLLYDSNNQPKAAYNTLISMLPASEWGDGSNPSGGEVTPIEPNEYGWYFSCPFEGDTCSWEGRGPATVSTSGRTAYVGDESLLVQDRTSAWNGASMPLNRAFKAGEEYSFSVNVNYFDGPETDDFYLKLQYTDASGETQYSSIAEGKGVKGQWVQLANKNYKIPDGATNLQIYVETAETTNNFYIDEAIGAVAGTTIIGAGQPVVADKGDVTADGSINVLDVTAIKHGIIKGFDGLSKTAADVNGDGSVNVADLLILKKYILGMIDEFPESEITPDEPENPSDPLNPVVADGFVFNSALAYREAPANYLDADSSIKGTVVNETYTGINGENKLNVYLPKGYDSNKKYNVFYLMHGGGENENTIFSDDVKLHNMLDHMIANGEIPPMIVVTPTFNKCSAETVYNEMKESIVPFVEGKYSSYAASTSPAALEASRLHRAYGGFSMGGGSTWNVLINDNDYFAYYMPLSGHCWGGADAVTNAVKNSKYKNAIYILAATGTDDIAYGNLTPLINNLKTQTDVFTYTSDFSKGNLYYLEAQGNTHWWGVVRHYVYDALPYFFHHS